MTYYLRFPSKKTGLDELQSAGFIDENNEIIIASNEHAIDVIGRIIIGGESDEAGNIIVKPSYLMGWHINYIGNLPLGWEQYITNPELPVRVFM